MGIDVGSSVGGTMKDMNVTPFIDVLLVLLIIFMVITPLTPQGLEAELPQPARTDERNEQPRTVVISLSYLPGGVPGLKLNQDNVTWQELQARLHEIYKTRAERVLFIRADSELDFADVAHVMDIAYSVGVERVGLLTARLEAGGQA